jgi:gliding motility-associated-like protein
MTCISDESMTKTLRPFFAKKSLLFLLFITAGLHAQILTNGDFESGGSGNGFMVNNYTLINPLTGASSPGFYARTTDPALMNSAYISSGDHTSGSGNMLVFDGSTLGNQFFWTTGNTGGAIGGFTAGTSYVFSFWIKSVSDEVTADDATRANIGVFFVNASAINPANQNFLAPLPSDGWVNIQYSFVATADNVMVRLKTNNGQAVGNDFAVDDFSITEGGLPFQALISSVNPTCPTSTDGSITVNASGGTLPYSAFTMTGTVSQTNNNGVFTGLGEGTYFVTVSDAVGYSFGQTITLTAQNDLVLSDPVTICPDDATTLTATGGAGSYAWTANPPDASLNPGGSSQTVSPAVTTTYTVTSGSVSDPTNLIQNGDFEQGDALFTTEYNYVADPNPFGVQTAYAIVTSPGAWFVAFCSGGDHTTGSGNLMVFDGSTVPLANVLAWGNQNPVPVTPNTEYTFSYYVESVSADDPARLEVMINGVSQGLPISAPGAACSWTQVSYNWNSGANTTASFEIYDRNFDGGGNDFALDDITFREATTCQYQKSVTVTVTPGTTPAFSPVNPICPGESLSALPTTSNNGITGTWSPALNNAATTTYTFTPAAGQCASTATLTIAVNPSVTPTFAAIAPICSGAAIDPLPTTSDNGIAGTWSPAPDNTATTTYTFTPAAGQCASTATLTITVNPATASVFTPIAPVCAGSANPLPTASDNGIAGTWSPAFDNTATATYTFTPAAGQCATSATLTVTVSDAPDFTISEGCDGVSYTLSAVQENAGGSTYSWLDPAGAQIGTDASVAIAAPGNYGLIVTQGGCSTQRSIAVASTLCAIQKGISANNDGLNDYFDLVGYNVRQLKIFNRYGTVVYSKADYQNQWYGQSDKGDDLPDGTYYYAIDFADSPTKTGWIYINRAQ